MKLLLAFLLLFHCAANAAPPVNDHYADAIDLGNALPVTIAGTTAEATFEPGEYNRALSLSLNARSNSVWYRWTAPASGWVGATLPAGLSVIGFTDGAGVPGLDRIRSFPGYYQQIALPMLVTAGEVFYLQCSANYDTVPGPFSISLTSVPPPNDGPLWGGYTVLPRGPSHSLQASNSGATVAAAEVLPPGANTGATVYFLLDAYGPFPCEITTAGSSIDTVLAVYTNGQTSLLAWNDDAAPGDLTSRVTFTPAAASQWYIVQVGGYTGQAGNFQINVNYQLPPAPANDARSTAVDLGSAVPLSWPEMTHAATSEPGEVTPGGMRRSVWYRWTAPAAGGYKLDGSYPNGNETPAFCVWRDGPGLPGAGDMLTWGQPATFRAAAGESFLFSIGGRLGYLGYEYAGTVTLARTDPISVEDFDSTVAGPLRFQRGPGDGWITPWTYDDANFSNAHTFEPSQDATSWSAVTALGSLGSSAGRRVTVPAVNGTVSLARGLWPDYGTNGTVAYFSFLISTETTAANAFAGVRLRMSNGPMIFMGKPGAGATDKWVIEDSGGADQQSFQSWPIVRGRAARLVVRAAFGDVDEFKFYSDVGPDVEEYDVRPSIKTGDYLRVHSLSLFSNAGFEVDDLRAGPTWESVTQPAAEAPVIFNEAFRAADWDFNGDGIASAAEDAYFELVNRSSSARDLSGQSVWSYATGPLLLHTFPPGTVLQPRQSLVVFAGGAVAEGATAALGHAWVQRATGGNGGSWGDLYLRSTVETRQTVLASFTYYHYWFPTTRWPELTGSARQVWPHNDTRFVPGGHPGSPGRRVDLTPWLALTQSLTASISRGSVVEGAGWNAASLTISRPGPLTEPLTVQIRSSDPALVNASPDYVVIPAGAAAVTVPLSFMTDFIAAPDQTVTLSAIGSGFLNGTATVTVLENDRRIYLNEINAQSGGGGGGGDFGEFIELYDGGIGTKPLHDFIVVLFDADAPNDEAYRVVDLAGRMTGSTGFFVIDRTAFPDLPANWLTDGGGAVTIYKKRTGGGGGGGGGAASAPWFDYPPGTPPAATSWLVDAITHVTDDAPDLALIALFTPAGSQADEGPAPGPGVPHVSTARCPDARAPFDSGAFRRLMPTPGTWNLTYPGFAHWATSRGVTMAAADDDADGLDNLMEYALGGDPLTASSAHLIPAPLDNPFGELRLFVTKGPDAGYDPRLRWDVEASTDLVHWTTRDVVIVQEDCATLTAAWTGGTSRVQMRLKVTNVP